MASEKTIEVVFLNLQIIESFSYAIICQLKTSLKHTPKVYHEWNDEYELMS